MRHRFIAAVSAVSFALTAGVAHANLLQDPGFEAVTLAGGNYGNLLENFGPGGAIGPAWSNSSNYVLGIDTTYTEAGGTLKFVAHSGNVAMDLTGAGNQGPVTFSQTINNLSAGNYLLRFWLGDIYNSSYNLDASVNVFANSVQLGAGTFVTRTRSATATWQEFLVPFTVATTANTTIRFSTVGLTNDNYVGLDDVSLARVPEPGTLALLGLGLVGLAAARRRKR